MTPEQASKLTLAEQHEWFRRATSRRSLLRGGLIGAGAIAAGPALLGGTASAATAKLATPALLTSATGRPARRCPPSGGTSRSAPIRLRRCRSAGRWPRR
jgi:hypothetical protein